MDTPQIISVAVFVVTLAGIISGKVHRTLAALTGAVLLLVIHTISFDAALEHIDWNTLGVLLGMMMFVAVVKQSGVFEYLAIKCSHVAKGNPWKIMMLLMILTAVLSAFLDNVTTVLLIGPVTITICKLLDKSPVPFFLAEILSSNIGGTGTLIGDPPNIMIGSAAGYSFADFIMIDGPAAVLGMIAVIAVFYLVYGRKMTVEQKAVDELMQLDAGSYIKDHRLVRISVVMVALVVVGFMMHASLGLESSVIALAAAAVITLVSRSSIQMALEQVEWTTLAFFAGLFVIVGAMSETGVILMLANALIDATGGNVFLTMLVLLVGSAIISSFLDNIPFVATMIPILLAMEGAGMDVTPLWWAVSLGACLGGNGTIIGASANVVLTDISAKHGHEITFVQFMKIGFPVMLLTIAISAVYLIVLFPPA